MKSYSFPAVLTALVLFLSGFFCPSCTSFRPVPRSDRANLRYEEGERWFNDWTEHPERIPVSFTYAGKNYRGLQGLSA
ncbi:MAG: hypothetical protein IJS62_03930, partial [Bacteroidales bacterium]|nr:hypothetical protein [Bacteroidales bacterium]